jgi:hypothetical protein
LCRDVSSAAKTYSENVRTCEVCTQGEESSEHIISGCAIAVSFWAAIGVDIPPSRATSEIHQTSRPDHIPFSFFLFPAKVDACPPFLGFVQIAKFLEKNFCSNFIVIWQNLSKHGLTRPKRFVLTFTDKLCNWLFF